MSVRRQPEQVDVAPPSSAANWNTVDLFSVRSLMTNTEYHD